MGEALKLEGLEYIEGVKVEVPKIPVYSSATLPAKKTAVLVVDMQNDFVDPKGKLYVPRAREIVEPIKRLLERARSAGVLVAYTKDTHYPGDPEFAIWGEHAVKGTWGWEIVDELAPREGEPLFEKPRYDGFYGTALDDYLRTRGVEYLVAVGIVANICLLHTASGAAMRWYRLVVPIDAIAAANDFDYYVALRQLSFVCRSVLVKSADGVKFA